VHVGRSYRIPEFLAWTREDIYVLIVLGLVPVVLYQALGLKWLGIPWTAVALLGTATAFIVGFKNIQTYNRTWEARQIWGDIVGSSRAWGTMSRDFVKSPGKTRTLVYRHLAWLTALRYHMRERRAWETVTKPNNAEYRKRYCVPEQESALEVELAKYLPRDELAQILSSKSRATQIVALQSRTIKELYDSQEIVVLQFVDMQRAVRDLHLHQARSERIKEFPFPRQYATVSSLFVRLFCLLLPFGLQGVRPAQRERGGLDQGSHDLAGHPGQRGDLLDVYLARTGRRKHRESLRGGRERRSHLAAVPQRRNRLAGDHWRIGSAGSLATSKQHRAVEAAPAKAGARFLSSK
jgi:putative membrane protein